MLATLEKPKAFRSKSLQRFLSSKATEPNTIFDDLYRLTGETISYDPVTANIGTINYTYDAVGNRQMRSSGITPISTQNFTGQYDPDDRLTAGYTYDGDGNTLQDPAGNTYQYDSLDRMTQATVNGNTSNYVYDGDGNKVQETSNSGIRQFLIDWNNPTGYSQVLEVLQSGNVQKVYTYGVSRISQDQQLPATGWTLSFYGYDGQGSVRYLTDINGNVVNPYEYDAFGNTIYQNNTVPNAILFDGEEQSPNSGFYNLRARWMNPGIGRFQTMDDFEGYSENPTSLHKYTFTNNNPINTFDPTGNDPDIGGLCLSFSIGAILSAFPNVSWAHNLPSTGSVSVQWLDPYIEHDEMDNGQMCKGVQVDLGAHTNKDTDYAEYRWVQIVTISNSFPGYKDSTTEYDGDPRSVAPQYYWNKPGEEDAARRAAKKFGYDTAFFDWPHTSPIFGENYKYDFDAHCYLVGVNPLGASAQNAVPLIEIHYGYTSTKKGLTVKKATIKKAPAMTFE